MAAIPARALLAGKVLGNSIMAFAQIVAIAIAGVVALAVTGQDNLFTLLGPSVLWFVGFFAVGFVLIASLFAASAVLVSRQEDVGSVTMPVMMLVMIPYILIVVAADDPTIVGIMSYVPFSAPIGMPMRIFLGRPSGGADRVAAGRRRVGRRGRRRGRAHLRERAAPDGGRVKLAEALRG